MNLRTFILESMLANGIEVPAHSQRVTFADLRSYEGTLIQATGYALIERTSETISDLERRVGKAEWEGMATPDPRAEHGYRGPFGENLRVAVSISDPGAEIDLETIEAALNESRERDISDLLVVSGFRISPGLVTGRLYGMGALVVRFDLGFTAIS